MTSISGNINAQPSAVSNLQQATLTSLAVPPYQQHSKEGQVQLQSTLRGLKDTYVQIEQQIEKETQKQRQSHQQRYASALDKIHSLKKMLKTEVEQRKNAEEHFRSLIDEKSRVILNQFEVSYLNKLHAMHETV